MAQRPWIVLMPGTNTLVHLRPNIGAIHVDLFTEDIREIDTAFCRR